jgi:addiction module RelE/StbE family toxin
MSVVWTRAALREIHAIHDYLADHNPEAARRMVEALFAAGDSLAEFPHRGRPVAGTAMRELLAVPPYIIRYRVAAAETVILRVRHGARRPTDP